MTVDAKQYAELVRQLRPLLKEFPLFVISIDGRCGSGKTTLGRYLAWKFNISLVETDLLMNGGGGFSYRIDALKGMVEHRLLAGRAPKPVIVEGVIVRKLLDEIGVAPSFKVHVTNVGPSSPYRPSNQVVRAYEKKYRPGKTSDFLLTISH